jgi:hypothetical protein
MRKLLTLVLFVLLLLPAPAQAAAPVDLSSTQGIVGGNVLDLMGADGSTYFAGGSLLDSPQVVEVYTATWCENCVPAEEALLDAIEGENATVLAFHRSIGEVEDPFGTQAGDERWIDLYGVASTESVGIERAPPTVVIDGTRLKAGSTPEGESLEADYVAMFADKHEFRNYNYRESDFRWTGTNSTGTLWWKLDVWPDDDLIWTHRLIVVEESAYFPEGSNGLEHYENVVRAVIDLDWSLQDNGHEWGGEVELELPAAWDGDDLSLVLIHEWQSVPHVDADPEPEDEGLLPGFLAPLGLIALGAAAMVRKD